jgi:hypothetical protein
LVRPQVYRIKKYQGKVTGDVVKARFDALKDTMAEQQEVRFSDLVNVENTVKGIVEPQGVPTILIPHYLNFGRELYSLVSRFSGTTLDNEALLVFTKWKTRGLTVTILKAIGSAFGLDTSGWS